VADFLISTSKKPLEQLPNSQDAIKQGQAQKIAVSILGAGGQLHERFVFTVQVLDSATLRFDVLLCPGSAVLVQ